MEYRPGAVGAMMDEYEVAAREFLHVLQPLSQRDYERIRDEKTQDASCRSIQAIASHVVASGRSYANYIRTAFGMPTSPRPENELTRDEIEGQMHAMLAYTVETLESRWLMTDPEIMAVRMKVSWGPEYDMEQLLEHAIVHILRHRRQIERFLRS